MDVFLLLTAEGLLVVPTPPGWDVSFTPWPTSSSSSYEIGLRTYFTGLREAIWKMHKTGEEKKKKKAHGTPVSTHWWRTCLWQLLLIRGGSKGGDRPP